MQWKELANQTAHSVFLLLIREEPAWQTETDTQFRHRNCALVVVVGDGDIFWGEVYGGTSCRCFRSLFRREDCCASAVVRLMVLLLVRFGGRQLDGADVPALCLCGAQLSHAGDEDVVDELVVVADVGGPAATEAGGFPTAKKEAVVEEEEVVPAKVKVKAAPEEEPEAPEEEAPDDDYDYAAPEDDDGTDYDDFDDDDDDEEMLTAPRW